jgi:hypothetical protein
MTLGYEGTRLAKPPPADRVPRRVFPLRHCTVSFYDHFAWTQFPSGQGWGAVPSDDPSYRALAARLGYGDDILAYCLEHDFLHSFLEQEVFQRPSPILYALAHDVPPPPTTCYEEALVQLFQGFLRNNWDMTATHPDIDWCVIRTKAVIFLGHDFSRHGSV